MLGDMAVSYATYERVALEDGDGLWELVCGRLRERPLMTQEHNRCAWRLMSQIAKQFDESKFEARMNAPALRIREGTYLVPDVAVFPIDTPAAGARHTSLETYEVAVPFVAEVWSPSTGGYDVETKLPEYQVRGDLEIWRIHPIDRDVTVWRRLPDGSYSESRHTSGTLAIESLPAVTIDLARLFA